MTSWEEITVMKHMTVLEQMQYCHWEMYKEAYNRRPRDIDTTTWTEEMFMEEFKKLARVIEENYNSEE